MASSHRPRKRGAHRPSTSVAPDRTPPGALQPLHGAAAKPKRQDSAVEPSDTSLATIVAEGLRDQADGHQDGNGVADYLNMPVRPPLTSDGSGISYYVQGRNNSVASFDSLATSYNSHTSSFSGSEAASNVLQSGGPTSPWPFTNTPDAQPASAGATSFNSSADGIAAQHGAFMGFTSPKSPFMVASGGGGAPPKAHGPSRTVSGLDAIQQHQRSPYPGVWRRMKRWSREAGKVIGLVDTFCSTPEGRGAAERALGHPLHELGTRASGWNSGELGPTKGNLGNALRAIAAIDIATFVLQLDAYKDFVRRVERKEGQSKRVFAHNDSQYGNLLIKKSAQIKAGKGKGESGRGGEKGTGQKDAALQTGSAAAAAAAVEGSKTPDGRDVARGMPRDRSGSIVGSLNVVQNSARGNSRSSSRSRREAPHHALVVIDFEYAAPNPRGFDIANHFQEWRTDYHHPTLSWSLTHHLPYPNESERRRWLRAYVEQGRFLRLRVGASKLPVPEAPASAQSGGKALKPPAVSRKLSDLDDLEALPPPAVPVHATATGPKTTATQDVQRTALEQSSGMRSGLPSGAGARSDSAGRRLDVSSEKTPPSAQAQAQVQSQVQSPQTPSLGRRTSSSSSSFPVQDGQTASRTIKVANSPALQALYSPSLSPYIGPFTSLGAADGAAAASGGGGGGGPAQEASAALAKLETSIEKEVDRIEHEVWLWGPACHALWGLWGIVFAKEEIEQLLHDALDPAAADAKPKEAKVLAEGEGSDVDSFDYLRYTLGRIELFRQEIQSMDMPLSVVN